MPRDTPFRRATIWLATLGYALVVSGLPLPLGGVGPSEPGSAAAKRLAGKDRSRPFPCMDKPCGCATAEQCFSNCCCNTPAELLAWARARRIEPEVIAALQRRVAAPTGVEKPSSCCAVSKPRSCCERQESTSCCAVDQLAASCLDGSVATSESASTDCSGESSAQAEPAAPENGRPRGRSDRVVVLRAMLACGGVVAQWCAAAGALPPPAVETSLECPVLAWIGLVDEIDDGPAAAPQAPPPRVA